MLFVARKVDEGFAIELVSWHAIADLFGTIGSSEENKFMDFSHYFLNFTWKGGDVLRYICHSENVSFVCTSIDK